MKLLFTYSLLIISIVMHAQEAEAEKILIKEGQNPFDILTPARIYRFPGFVKGTVFFRDGTESNTLMNYNFLNGEVEFIDKKGDTLVISAAQQLNIKWVKLDTVYFYPRKGYLERLAQNNHGKLLQQQFLVRIKRQKIGAYDVPAETAATDSRLLSYHVDPLYQSKTIVRENITLQKKTQYFFGDEFNTFLPANKKNLIKLFSGKKDELELYLKNHEVDFRRGDDLKKLFVYMQTL